MLLQGRLEFDEGLSAGLCRSCPGVGGPAPEYAERKIGELLPVDRRVVLGVIDPARRKPHARLQPQQRLLQPESTPDLMRKPDNPALSVGAEPLFTFVTKQVFLDLTRDPREARASQLLQCLGSGRSRSRRGRDGNRSRPV